MGRSNTESWKKIHAICRVKRLDEKKLYDRTKKLLNMYRGVCWSTAERADELGEDICYYCGTELDEALIFLETFAPDSKREEFEDRIRTLFETRWMTELVETAMLKVREFPDRGELYYRIVFDCFLGRFKYSESELLEQFGFERSCFYDRKKEAVMIFGIAMWGTAIPKLKGYLREDDGFYEMGESAYV